METMAKMRLKVSEIGATLDMTISLDRELGPSITRDSLKSLPRSEAVELTREITIRFSQLMQDMGLPLSVIGESLQNAGSLSKAVGKGDSDWEGNSLMQMRRDERKAAVIQKEQERKKAKR